MKLVDAFEYSPGVCAVCGCTPMKNSEDHVDALPAGGIDLEVEIDFGDQAYMCMKCAGLLVELIGASTVEQTRDREAKIQALETAAEEQTAVVEKLERFKEKVLRGRDAIREERAA